MYVPQVAETQGPPGISAVYQRPVVVVVVVVVVVLQSRVNSSSSSSLIAV